MSVVGPIWPSVPALLNAMSSRPKVAKVLSTSEAFILDTFILVFIFCTRLIPLHQASRQCLRSWQLFFRFHKIGCRRSFERQPVTNLSHDALFQRLNEMDTRIAARHFRSLQV